MLHAFLMQHIRPSGSKELEQTHSWFVPNRKAPYTLTITDDTAEFMSLYCDAVDEERCINPLMNGNTKNPVLCLSEKISKVFPMFLDIDMDPDVVKLLGGPKSVGKFVEACVNEIRSLVKQNSQNSEELAQESAQYYTTERLFYKVHVHWPTMLVTREIAENLVASLIARMKACLDNAPVAKFMDKIVDKQVYATGLRMLGSHKGSIAKANDQDSHLANYPSEPYNSCYWLRTESAKTMTTFDIINITSIHKDGVPIAYEIKKPVGPVGTGEVGDLVPKLKAIRIQEPKTIPLSVVDGASFIEDDRGADINHSTLGKDVIVELNAMCKLASTKTGVPIVPSRIAKLSATHVRMDLEAGACPMAGRCHDRTTKHNQSTLWVHMTPHEGVLRCWKCKDTLLLWDTISDAMRVKLFNLNVLDTALLSCLQSPTSELITNFIMACFADTHAASQKTDTVFRWFTYIGNRHKWIEYKFIMDDIMRVRGPVQRTLNEHARNLIGNEEDPKVVQKIQASAASLSEKLQKWSYLQREIMSHLGYKLHVQSLRRYNIPFGDMLDQNPAIMGCANGVYDFKAKTFRRGQPSDLISRSTNVNYMPWATLDGVWATRRDAMMDALRKIWPVEEEFHYFMFLLSRCLDGTPTSQQFFIPLGHGANGKSIVWRLINATLGEYAGECDVTFFTRPRPSSNAPTEDLMAMVGKRIVVCNEPNEKDQLHTGPMKAVTGGDRMTGRHNYGQQQSFYLQCTFFMLCNRIPQINASPDEYGTWRRIRPLPFRSRFTDTPTRPNDVLADPDITTKLNDWREVFFSLLVHYVETVDNVPEPLFYSQARLALRDQHNHFDRFIKDHVEQDQTEVVTSCVQLYTAFRTYIRNMGLNKVVTFDEFERKMSVTLGEPEKDPLTQTLQWRVGLNEPAGMF